MGSLFLSSGSGRLFPMDGRMGVASPSGGGGSSTGGLTFSSAHSTLKRQDIRVLSLADTLETLQKLHERLKDKEMTSPRIKQRVKGLETLCITLALQDYDASCTESSEAATANMVLLCQTVAKCFPRLLRLEIVSDDDFVEEAEKTKDEEPIAAGAGTTFAMPVQALTALLHPNKGLKKLQELTLDGLTLDADEERMRILGKAIDKHTALQRCYLYETTCTTAEAGGTRKNGMEKLVTSLGRKVEKLVIVACRLAPPPSFNTAGEKKKSTWAGSCLVKLCKSTTLQEFKLHNVEELQEEHIVLMAQALGKNTSLKKLSILKPQELSPLPEEAMLGGKKKVVDGHLQRQDSNEHLTADASTLALANMLRVNTTLEELCLSAYDFTEYSALFLGNALEEDNTTLKDLWLMIPAHNGGTSSFPVDDKRIDYCLRLNRAGRQKFVSKETDNTKEPQPSLLEEQVHEADAVTAAALDEISTKMVMDQERRERLESIVSSKRDIDCSYFKLRQRPSLCDYLGEIAESQAQQQQ